MTETTGNEMTVEKARHIILVDGGNETIYPGEDILTVAKAFLKGHASRDKECREAADNLWKLNLEHTKWMERALDAEKELASLRGELRKDDDALGKYEDKVSELEKELAEKDAEIERLQKSVDYNLDLRAKNYAKFDAAKTSLSHHQESVRELLSALDKARKWKDENCGCEAAGVDSPGFQCGFCRELPDFEEVLTLYHQTQGSGGKESL